MIAYPGLPPGTQIAHNTRLLREIHVLCAAQAALECPADRQPKILSFGCSTGEEIVTLRWMFPDAEIYGCDVHEPTLAVAARTVGDLGTLFMSGSTAVAEHGPYDVIVCSAASASPAPPQFSQDFEFTRSNLDGVAAENAAGAIEIIRNTGSAQIE